MEAGHQDNGREDYQHAKGAPPAADARAEDARELGPYCEPDRDVQVSICPWCGIYEHVSMRVFVYAHELCRDDDMACDLDASLW